VHNKLWSKAAISIFTETNGDALVIFTGRSRKGNVPSLMSRSPFYLRKSFGFELLEVASFPIENGQSKTCRNKQLWKNSCFQPFPIFDNVQKCVQILCLEPILNMHVDGRWVALRNPSPSKTALSVVNFTFTFLLIVALQKAVNFV